MRKVVLPKTVKATIAALVFIISTTSIHAQPQVAYQPIISSGLSEPIEVVTAPGDVSGRLFIVQKGGLIRIWNGSSLLITPFLDISSISADDGERGLLSMAFHPQYQSNGFFFVYYNDNAGNITVARYQVSGNPDIANPIPNPAAPLVSIPKNFTNHNGGHLQFRVEGGTNYLYFATGDGGSGNDPDNNAQDLTSFLGKMIRMDVDAVTPVPEIWAWGLRNPFRWSFDRSNGDIWIGDVGQGLKEEVSYRAGGTGGANYGWACFEGTLTNSSAPAGSDCDSVGNVDVLPIFEYDNPPSGSSSVIGGYVYRGTEFPSLQGWYMTADFYSGQFWLIGPNGVGGWTVSTQTGLPAFIASFSETSDGSAIYAVSLAGNTLYKLVVPIVTPLRLTHFSGNAGAGYNDLRWITEAEENIEKYIVEYSVDGINYQPAGEVPALNNSNGNTYSFRHTGVAEVKTFYRLHINELNGRYSFSPVIIVRGDDKIAVKLYPTVISNSLINIIAGKPVEKITVVSMDGRMVLAKTMNGTDGYFTLPLPSLQKGVYLVQVAGKGFQQTEKIIIQ